MNPPVDSPPHRVPPERLARQIADLPALPAIVHDLLKNVKSAEADVNVVARKVSLDQALSAKILRFANSPVYGLQARVTTIQQAITLIGIDAVRRVALAATLKNHLPSGQCTGVDFVSLWRHAIATAVCARALAWHLHVNQDYAFTAGLLHDIGRLMLATHFRTEYEAVAAYRTAHDCQWLDAERAVMGIDHTTAGEVLADHWKFSDSIRHAIAGHHNPEHQKVHSLASIVHVANAIVHALDLSGTEDDLVPPLSQTAWDDLGLSEEIYQHVFHETELMFEEVSRVLLTND